MSTDKFFDINKFPADWGVVVFPISMGRIQYGQSSQKCANFLYHLSDKISSNQVGANFIYSDALYMNFETNGYATKNNFAQSSISHMQGLKKLIKKDFRKFQIENAFSFQSWFQLYLNYKGFFVKLAEIRKTYDSDPLFQKICFS